MGDPVCQAHFVQRFARGAGRVRVVGQFQGQHDVFQGGQRRYQVKGLKDEAHVVSPQGRASVLIEQREVLVFQLDVARRGNIQPRQQAQQGRLTRAGNPDHGNAFTRSDFKVYAVQDGELTLWAADVLGQLVCG